MRPKAHIVLQWLGCLAAVMLVAFLLSGVAHCQTFEMVGVVYWPKAGAFNSEDTPHSVAARESGDTSRPSIRITASRQPISVLRAITKEKPPEGAGIFSVCVCNVSLGDVTIDAGEVEQQMEARGIAITPRALTELAVKRSRNRGLSVLAKVGEVALIAAPMVLGMAAGGVIQLNSWQAASVAGFGTALNIIGEASKPELQSATGNIEPLGVWLSDARRIALTAGECSARMLTMGSYRPGMPQVYTMDLQ